MKFLEKYLGARAEMGNNCAGIFRPFKSQRKRTNWASPDLILSLNQHPSK